MILGIGVDVVDVARLARSIEATPSLRERLFTETERELPLNSLAARFAAKEATIKAFGGPVGGWHEVWVERSESGKPELRFEGAAAELARSRGVQQVHLSLSHDGPVATAFVILEGAA